MSRLSVKLGRQYLTAGSVSKSIDEPSICSICRGNPLGDDTPLSQTRHVAKTKPMVLGECEEAQWAVPSVVERVHQLDRYH